MPSRVPAQLLTQLYAALGYFGLYLLWLCFSLENELWHWVTLVLLPILLMLACAEPAKRSLVQLLGSCGISWDRIHKGYLPAAVLGIGLCLLQFLISNQAAELRILFSQRQGFWLLLPAFALMVFTAGFTEEFFFRGYLQTRLASAVRNPWLAILAASMLFALYHVPYAYLKPSWPSHGNLLAAITLAFGQSLPIGILLGWIFQRSGNLLSAVMLHALADTMPAVIWLHEHLS